MPKYHYRCDGCTRVWWQWSSVADSNIINCPYCDHISPQKVPVEFIKIDTTVEEKKGAKENVVGHIEENREILKKMRKHARNKDITNDD